MSGFEVVGVILGAAPLIISALEGCQKISKKRDAFKRRALHIDRMKNAVRWQHELLEHDVRIVLQNAGMEDLSTRGGAPVSYQKLLLDPDVQDGLREYLGHSCQSYLDIAAHCATVLLEIIESLGSVEDKSWIRFNLHYVARCEELTIHRLSKAP